MCTHALSGLFHNAKLRIVSPVFKWASSEWRFVQAWAGVSRGGKFMGVTHQSLSLYFWSQEHWASIISKHVAKLKVFWEVFNSVSINEHMNNSSSERTIRTFQMRARCKNRPLNPASRVIVKPSNGK